MDSRTTRIFWLLLLGIILNGLLAIWCASQGDTIWLVIHCVNLTLIVGAMGKLLDK